MAEGLLFVDGLFVLLMSDALLHNILFHTLCLLDVSTACLEDRVHLRAQADVFGNGAPSTLVLHLPQHLFVGVAVQWVIRRVVRGVVELWMFGHVFVDVFRLDLEEETVGVGVEELAPVPVLPPELVVIEVVHQVFREIQNTHPYIYWAIELQTALVDLDSRQVVIEDIGPSKRRAGDEAPEFVLLVSSHQLHVNPLPQVLHGLPEDRVVHQLVKVLLEVAGCLLPELSIFSDVRLHPRALTEPEGAMDRSQAQAQRHVQLQIPIVEHVAALVAEVGDQLLNLSTSVGASAGCSALASCWQLSTHRKPPTGRC